MGKIIEMDDAIELQGEQVLEAALELLRPLKIMHAEMRTKARRMGLVIPLQQVFPVRFPFSQLEMVANFVSEVEDGLANGWSQKNHPILYNAVRQAIQIEEVRNEKGIQDEH